MPLSSPVVLLVFNRPDLTRRSFELVRQERPETLFVVADRPRPGRSDDEYLCQEVRRVVSNVDWDCDVRQNYSDTNMGLKRRVVTGLDWVFSQVDRAIILEDDCVAHPDFFRFSDLLLDVYEEDERVAVVTGNNFQDGIERGSGSYYFSKYNHCWGWATWRRAWSLNDPDIRFWRQWSASAEWIATTPDPIERRYWEGIFDRVHAGEIDSWAYPWTASVWFSGGLTATPNTNLVSNIGFGPEATHTTFRAGQANLRTEPLGEIRHPLEVAQDEAADKYTFDHHFGGEALRAGRTPIGLMGQLIGGLRRRTRRWLKTRRSRISREGGTPS